MSMYIELDRDQVIDRNLLKERFPREYDDDRHKVPERLFGQFHRVKYLAYPCIAGFLLNGAFIGIFMRRQRVGADTF